MQELAEQFLSHVKAIWRYRWYAIVFAWIIALGGWVTVYNMPVRYDLAMTAEVNGTETSRGRWSDAQFSFGQMLARASADVHLRPGDLIGSGTVGTGCLLEVRDATLGRYLEPGDEVVLRIDRLGALRTRIVPRPTRLPAKWILRSSFHRIALRLKPRGVGVRGVASRRIFERAGDVMRANHRVESPWPE